MHGVSRWLKSAGWPLQIVSLCVLLCLLYFNGVVDHLVEVPFRKFQWPPFVDVKSLVKRELSTLNVNRTVHLQPHSFTWLHEPKTMTACRSGSAPWLRVMVKSAAGNFHQRAAIRDSWGRAGSHFTATLDGKRFGVYLNFAVANPENVDDRVQLALESKTFGDVLWVDIRDNYRNNTLKVLSLFHWLDLFIESCVDFDYLLLIDDDFFLNFANLLRLITKYDADRNAKQYVYTGYRFDTSPFRLRWHKHYVSLADYPFDAYPPYITAGAILMNGHTARSFAVAARYMDYYPYDDIFLAMIAYQLGVPAVHDERFLFWPVSYSEEGFKEVVAAHGFGSPLSLGAAVDHVPCTVDRAARQLSCS